MKKRTDLMTTAIPTVTQLRYHTFASLQVALKDKECDGAPEDDLETTDDDIGFVAMPSFELLNMFRRQHVREKDERFGSLVAVSIMMQYIVGLCVPFRER
jgi:hypothetical protein